MEIGEIVGDICHVGSSRLGLWGPLPSFFTEAKKLQFWAKSSSRFSNGGFLFLNGKEYWKSNTAGFINDYVTIPSIHPKFGVGQLNSYGEMLVQIGVG